MSTAEQRGLARINETFLTGFPAEAAEAIDELSRDEAVDFLGRLRTSAVVAVWPYLSHVTADETLPQLPDTLVAELMARIEPGVSAALLRRADDELRARCLALLPPTEAAEIRRLIDYPPNTVGQIMDSRFASFRPEETVAAVLKRLRQIKPRGLRQLHVVDEERRLVSIVDIQDLAIADAGQTLAEIAQPPRATTSPFEASERVAEQLKDSSIEVLPVVDVSGRLLGVVRHAALLRTLREETSADIQLMVGVGKEERALSSPLLAVRKRLPWLEVNLATAFLAAAVVGLFESTIAQFTALAVLLPVVAGQSGNAGAQALAVTMRGLALREVTERYWYQVMFKEAGVGLMNGIAIALTTALGVLLWSRSSGLALVIGIAMVVSMIAAGISGSLIPMILTRIGQDPAQSSSIILTTVTDIVGFMSFLGIATLMAGML